MPKTVYIGMTADICLDSCISVIETARRYGDVLDSKTSASDKYRKAVRDVLETTAEMIEDHKLGERFRLYRQRCEVVDPGAKIEELRAHG